tara:strand:+ start:1067 stop:2056 length:990 start_codon:yes stop_codon:yes gene_type:complete
MIYKSYSIEQNINNIHNDLVLFYGENLGLINDFKEQIKKEYKRSSVINIFQEEITKNSDNFFNEIFNKSLFEEEKIYFINQVDDKLLEIFEELENKIDKQKIFIFSGILDKKSKLRNFFEKSKKSAIIACYKDNEITLKKIVQSKLNSFKGLSQENINIIIENCNLDRNKLNNELNKILAFFDQKVLEKSKLESILNIKTNDDFSILRDEAMNGNNNNTNKLLNDTYIEPEKNILYLNMIYKRLEKLLEIHKLAKKSSLEEAVNNVKPPIFWKDKPIISNQLRKWNENKIKYFLTSIYNLELQIKSSSTINNKILIKKLVVDTCNLANS